MHSFTALVRKPGQNFTQALSEHSEKNNIKLGLALQQHKDYVKALEEVGGHIEYLPSQENSPDATFVEDAAIILNDKALLCPMKELSRQTEVESIAKTLKPRIECVNMDPPATLDGGDVMMTPDTIFVGISKRTNINAVKALEKLTPKKVIPVVVKKGLHLKSAVTYLGNNLLVIDSSRIETSNLKQFEWINVNHSYSANCLALGDHVLMPSGFPDVHEKIISSGFKAVELEMSEFEKADGAITCLSIILTEKTK